MAVICSMRSFIAFLLLISVTVSEGLVADVSREITIYADQSLTLSCQSRDSPEKLIYWHWRNRSHKATDNFVKQGPTYTINKATVDDTGFFSCSAAEWGIWAIMHYIFVNVIEPGKPSCANGWSFYKNSCFMHSSYNMERVWREASSYCTGSSARLAKVPHDSDDDTLRFMSVLTKGSIPAKRSLLNLSTVWVGSASHPTVGHQNQQGGTSSCAGFNAIKRKLDEDACTKKCTFICERVLPEVPKDVSIEYINSSAVRVGWNLASSGSNVTNNYVELSIASGNVIKRQSSHGKQSVIFTHLLSNTQYRVRVQAENTAGNGTSSQYVSFKMYENILVIPTPEKNNLVIAGHSVTLRCGQPHHTVRWYREKSNEPLNTSGQELTIHSVSSKDEGTYHCKVDQGPRVSFKVLVVEHPVITDIKGIFLEQNDKVTMKRELLLLCNTTNRHPLKYAWLKDGEPLNNGEDSVKVSLQDDETNGKYTCQVSNIAGSASRSLVISSVGGPEVSEVSNDRSKSTNLVTVIAVFSVLLIICSAVGFTHRRITKLITKKMKSRKMTMQSTSTEMATVEEMESPRPESPTETITRDSDEVFPYDVISTWTGSNGLYMSLRREGNDGELEDTTQVARTDYTNISPSNRNNSAAICMYAPLMHTAGLQGAKESKGPYVNVNTVETSSDM